MIKEINEPGDMFVVGSGGGCGGEVAEWRMVAPPSGAVSVHQGHVTRQPRLVLGQRPQRSDDVIGVGVTRDRGQAPGGGALGEGRSGAI